MISNIHAYRLPQWLHLEWGNLLKDLGFVVKLESEKGSPITLGSDIAVNGKVWQIRGMNELLRIGEIVYPSGNIFIPDTIGILNWPHGKDLDSIHLANYFECLLCASGARPCQPCSFRFLCSFSTEFASNWPSLFNEDDTIIKIYENSPGSLFDEKEIIWECGELFISDISFRICSGPIFGLDEKSFLAFFFKKPPFLLRSKFCHLESYIIEKVLEFLVTVYQIGCKAPHYSSG